MSEPVDDHLRITLRIPKEVHAAVNARAREEDRSINGQIVALLRRGLQAPAPQAPQQGAQA